MTYILSIDTNGMPWERGELIKETRTHLLCKMKIGGKLRWLKAAIGTIYRFDTVEEMIEAKTRALGVVRDMTPPIEELRQEAAKLLKARHDAVIEEMEKGDKK